MGYPTQVSRRTDASRVSASQSSIMSLRRLRLARTAALAGQLYPTHRGMNHANRLTGVRPVWSIRLQPNRSYVSLPRIGPLEARCSGGRREIP